MNKLFWLLLILVTGCANGKDGADGIQGLPGLPGQPGGQGPQGPGTVVTMVKFCPGPTVFPTTFPEYGFCVSGNLYATYSANSGFTALLVPGTYQSNAVGSTCTFVVGPNCQVTVQ